MTNGVSVGQSCGTPTGKFIFGRDAGGAALICGGTGQPNVWVAAGYPVVSFDKLVTRGAWRRFIAVLLVGLSHSHRTVTR
jgi:hypothetical protein